MCFFINLEFTLQPKLTGRPASLDFLAKLHSVSLRGTFPVLQVTDGHCSCHLVLLEGRSISVTDFVQEVLTAEEIKNIRVGWTWAIGQNVQMKPDISEIRLTVQEFVERNAAAELQPDVWYRLHDPTRYEPHKP